MVLIPNVKPEVNCQQELTDRGGMFCDGDWGVVFEKGEGGGSRLKIFWG